ncbi:MAG: hypothetical protein Q8O98_00170 [bacterium]|nr:hypothetical protein [bacterium]
MVPPRRDLFLSHIFALDFIDRVRYNEDRQCGEAKTPNIEVDMTVQPLRLSQEEYVDKVIETIREQIELLEQDDVLIVALQPPLKRWKECVPFLFGTESVEEALLLIREWAKKLNSTHYFLPKFYREAIIFRMKENELDGYLETEITVPEERLRLILERIKEMQVEV